MFCPQILHSTSCLLENMKVLVELIKPIKGVRKLERILQKSKFNSNCVAQGNRKENQFAWVSSGFSGILLSPTNMPGGGLVTLNCPRCE